MNKSVEHIILGIFCAGMALIIFFSGRADADKRNNWIETEAVVNSYRVETDSDSGGKTWYCVITYTREDGSQRVENDVAVRSSVTDGDTVTILYDPDSDEMQTGGKPSVGEGKIGTVFGCISAAAAFLFFIAALREEFRQRH